MGIQVTITAQEAGSLQVSVAEDRIELFASGRKLSFEGVSGDFSVRVLPALDIQEPEAVPAVEPMVLAFEPDSAPAVQPDTPSESVVQAVQPDMVEDAEHPLFQVLVALRRQIASEAKLPPFVIFHDRTLREMCERLPADLEALQGIPGVGRSKLDKYGARFIEIIRRYVQAVA
ncbi:MAG: HRDC domain-containing protein [Candidatus Saccharibacteria bacterium]